ncbi:MAG: glycosyltransferase [bacterium]
MHKTLPRILVVMDRYPIEGDWSFSGWFIDHVHALEQFALVDVLSVINMLPRLKNLLGSRREQKWIQANRAVKTGMCTGGGGLVFHKRIFNLPYSLTWEILPILVGRQLESTIESLLRANQYDLILEHFAYPVGNIVGRIAREHLIPFVIINHDGPGAFRKSAARKACRAIISILDQADCIVTLSKPHTREISSLFCDKTIVEIPLGVHIPSESKDPNIDPSVLQILTIARLDSPGKNIEHLLYALASMKSSVRKRIHLSVAGDGWQLRWLKFLSMSLNLQAHVTFLGWQPHPVLMKSLGKYDALALASEYETMSLAALEALAAGVPVIGSSEVGILSNIYSMGKGIIPLPELTPYRWLSQFEALMDKKDEIREMGREAREFIKEHFSWECHTVRFQQLCERMLKGQDEKQCITHCQ